MGGELDVLGLVSLSLEFIMSLAYESAGNGNGVVWGEATLIAEVEVVCFSDSVEISVRREFGDPASARTCSLQDDWAAYWGAFEAAAWHGRPADHLDGPPERAANGGCRSSSPRVPRPRAARPWTRSRFLALA